MDELNHLKSEGDVNLSPLRREWYEWYERIWRINSRQQLPSPPSRTGSGLPKTQSAQADFAAVAAISIARNHG